MQLDTFSFSSNFLNMIQGEEGDDKEVPGMEEKIELQRARRRRLPEDGRRGRSVRLLLTGRGARFTAFREIYFRSLECGVALCGSIWSSDYSPGRACKRAGLEKEGWWSNHFCCRKRRMEGACLLFFLIGKWITIRPITHARNRGTNPER